MTSLATLPFAAMLLVGCAAAGALDLRAATAQLSPEWRHTTASDESAAFHHRAGGTIATSIGCGGTDEDAPLDVLLEHELMELDNRVEREREAIVIDGRQALCARVDARLDGVPVALELVILKKDGCVVDVRLVGSASAVEARRGDFERFVARLAITRASR